MARRGSMITGFLGDLIDDTKSFVDDLIDRAQGLEADLRDAARNTTDDNGRQRRDIEATDGSDADLASIRLNLAALRTKVDELATLQGRPMEPDGIIVPSTVVQA